MEIVKEKRIGVIIFLACIAALLLANSAFGQIERMSTFDYIKNKIVVTRYSSTILELKSPLFSKESITINAKSDSIDTKSITFDIFAYFPKNINPEGASIVIGYTDGTTDLMQQTYFDKDENYAEYHPVDGINNLSNKKISYVHIRGIVKCETKDKTYFSNFLSYL